jgi:sarcosine oxidase subunit gamma
MPDALTIARPESDPTTRPTTASAEIARLPDSLRLVLRGGQDAAAAFGRALGSDLPSRSCTSVQDGSRAVLWLGPDEWLFLSASGDRLAPVLAESLSGIPGAVVDVSHRQVALSVAGTAAADVLNAGCPLDLDLAAFPIGMCTRTIFAKAEIVLWRRAAGRFHLEVARSFAAYLHAYLMQAVRDL